MSKFNDKKINPLSISEARAKRMQHFAQNAGYTIKDYKHYGLKNRRDNTITPKQYIVLGFVLVALIMAYSIAGMI